jgi:hypothetical protein
MQIFSEDIEFLRELYIQNSVSMYFFHEKYMLSPAQLGRTIRKFTDIGCVILNENCIELTEKGRRWIITNRRELFLKTKEKYWKNIPIEMTQEVFKIGDTYKPKKLDSELFKTLEDGE